MRATMRRVVLVAAAWAAAACDARLAQRIRYRMPSPEAGYRAVSLARLPAAGTADTLVFLGLEYPEPGPIGGLVDGLQYPVRVGTISLTDGSRRAWFTGSAVRMATVLRRAGYQVRQGAFESPTPLSGARFALIGRVVELAVQSVGGTGPHRVQAETQVAWELFDLAANGSVFGLRTFGRAQVRDSIAEAVLYASDSALVGLLADFRFRLALSRLPENATVLTTLNLPPPHSAADRAGPIPLDSTQANPLDTGSAATRIAAGVVTLRGADRFEEPAFVLTRDGLALTTLRAAGGAANLWVRFGTGVERPVRVLRRNERLGVALVHVPCPGGCTTVRWTIEAESSRVPILVMPAPAGLDRVPLAAEGEALGHSHVRLSGPFAISLTLPMQGGEPIARAQDGTVFGIVVPWRSAIRGLTLGDALRGLDVHFAATETRTAADSDDQLRASGSFHGSGPVPGPAVPRRAGRPPV